MKHRNCKLAANFSILAWYTPRAFDNVIQYHTLPEILLWAWVSVCIALALCFFSNVIIDSL